jgi:hypothetical protein
MLSVIFDEQFGISCSQPPTAVLVRLPPPTLIPVLLQSAGLLARASDRRRHRAAAQRDRQDCQAALVSQGIVDVIAQ